MPRTARLLTVALALLAGMSGSCTAIERLNARAFHRYHDSRLTAVAEALALQRAEVRLPSRPAAPLRCGPGMDDAYLELARLGGAERAAWAALLAQCDETVAYCSTLVDALSSRNIAAIQELAPRLTAVRAAQERTQQAWEESHTAVDAQLAALRKRWTTAWPQQDLEFDLAAKVDAARIRLIAPPDSATAARLAEYQANEFARLAMVYLAYEPAVLPDPALAPPPGAQDFATELARLECALNVRFNLDEAIELDVARVLEAATPAGAPAAEDSPRTIDWQALADGGRRYQEQRAAVSIARLRLLKSVDELLTACLAVETAQVAAQWEQLWPQNPLTQDVFALAGGKTKPEAPPPAAAGEPDPMRDLSFRQ